MPTKKSTKKGVLIVDDNFFTRFTLKNLIKKLNFASVVGEASDGSEAISLYKKLNPDLVTMDLVMEGMGGIEAIEEIMKIDESATIIVVSAIGQQMVIFEATIKGAKDFIRKPINKEDFLHVMKNFLAKR